MSLHNFASYKLLGLIVQVTRPDFYKFWFLQVTSSDFYNLLVLIFTSY